MPKKILLSAIFLLMQVMNYAQNIKGQIKLNDSFERYIYVIEVLDYELGFGANKNAVIDYIAIGPTGYFEFDSLKRNTLYRLNAVPKGNDRGILIQDGVNDNYAFIVTNDGNNTIYVSADVSKLFISFRSVSANQELNNLQQQIERLKIAKMPVYTLMYHLGTQMDSIPPSDTPSLNNFRIKAMEQLQEANKQSNTLLFAHLDSFTNPNVISLGFIFAGIGYQDVQNDVIRYSTKLLPYKEWPLTKSVLSSVISDVDISFLHKKYPLLDKKSLTMDSLKSRYVLLDFWASWCIPCRQSIRTTLKTLSAKYNPDMLTIIGVNMDKDIEAANKAIEDDNNVHAQIYGAEATDLSNRFKVNWLPTYILINLKTQNWRILGSVDLTETLLDE